MRINSPRSRYLTVERFEEFLEELNERMEQMASQADVDAVTAQVGQVATDLTAAQTALQSEIDALAAANPALDLTGLQNAVAPLDGAVQALGQIKPTPPAPPAGA